MGLADSKTLTTDTVSAGIDAGQSWRWSHCDKITYADWQRDNYERTVASIAGRNGRVGI